MTDTLLVVCTANVCRSPLAVAVLDNALFGQSLGQRIAMRSRGVDAEAGRPVCSQALQVARAHGVWTRTADHHLATGVERGSLAAADLILTADRRVRSRVVKLDPRVAERTFTIREAAALARLTSPGDHEHPPDLGGFAAALNDNRGLTDLPALERPLMLPWPRLRLHAHDVPDAHAEPQASHRVVYRTLVPAVKELAEHLAAFASVGRR